MLEKITRASAQHTVTPVGWISDNPRGGYPGMAANPVRLSIHPVASPKFLLTAAKILSAFIVAVAIMLLLVRGTTPTTPSLPDGKASYGKPSAARANHGRGTERLAIRAQRHEGVLTSRGMLFSSQSNGRATWLQTI